MGDVKIKIGSYAEIGTDAQTVRDEVFVVEQGISLDIERDAYDSISTHAVLYKNNAPVSAGRIVNRDNGHYIGRVSTLKEHRKNGYGGLIVSALVEWAFSNDIPEVHLHSQKHAENFYKGLGFRSYGEVFIEAGIEHISMVKNLFS